MPRPNPMRTISSEHALARRLAYERERRGWSYDGLASRMTKVGCPIQGSGLYKIEKAGRRITVDELVALAQVMEVDVEGLLQPVEMLLHADITKAESAEQDAWRELNQSVERVVEARQARAELYRRAMSGEDDVLGAAVDSFWAERIAASKAASESPRSKGGGLAKRVREWEAERAAQLAKMTESERIEDEAERERAVRLEDAQYELFEVIRDIADPDRVLGDS